MEILLRLLVIEDDPADYLLLERTLRQQGLRAECRRIDTDAELGIALRHGGDIVAEGRAGAGACFCIHLPDEVSP